MQIADFLSPDDTRAIVDGLTAILDEGRRSPEIVAGLCQGVLDAVRPAAAPALDHAAILEMAKPRHEQRS